MMDKFKMPYKGPEIGSCPFCGRNDAWLSLAAAGFGRVYCDNSMCRAAGPAKNTAKKALEALNKSTDTTEEGERHDEKRTP